jgi:hypothetical protein
MKNLLESGFAGSEDYQQRRVTLLTNSISLILVAVLAILFFVRVVLFKHAPPFPLLIEGLMFFVPVLLNRVNRPMASRLFLSVMPIVVLWYSFIGGMNAMPVIEVTVYDGLRLYLLAVSCIPFLVLGRSNKTLLVIGTLPSFTSVIFFEVILNAFDLQSAHAGSDYDMMQLRFIMAYILVAGSCYVLQRTLHKNDQINQRLLKRLREKNAIIECQNRELLAGRAELTEVNKQLEELLELRGRKIYSQRQSIISYAYANSHHVRGPVARLMGIVELYRVDRELGCDWLVETVDRETRQMDTTIRRLSKEMGALD